MPNIYDIYRKMEDDQTILSFKGDITQDLLTSVFEIMESKLQKENEDLKLKKKFNHVLIECLQNVYHHMEDLEEFKAHGHPDANANAIFIIRKLGVMNYEIITGNHIQQTKVEGLKSRIEKINSLNPETLKSYYLEMLSSTELSEKGGAGLGIIDMARKSGHKLQYSFDPVNESLSFFSLAIKISQ